ncbi:MAG: threonine ammonia-lyase [Phycisphaerales bacterium]|nr:threonine ammonia-lyase [Phycisphaerales bacterium]
MDVTFDHILAARKRIAAGIYSSPCERSQALSQLCGCEIYSKLEFLQATGSFKERGARNALMLLPDDRRAKGVIAASAGNHALALAYHGRELSIPVNVVMPTFAPLIKQSRCRELGAKVILEGANIAEAKRLADSIAATEGQSYIHGFDGPEVIAGQGTIALEILEQVPDPDAIIVPIGGGGLLAGIALAVKTANPRTQIVGVEPARASTFKASLAAGKPVRVEPRPTLADGLAVPEVGARAFALARDRTDRVELVEEEDIALAILRLAELEKGIVEGAGAVPLAAFIAGKLKNLAGKRVVLVLAGGNIDMTIMGRVIEHGMVTGGRLTQFTAVISDRPGGLADLAAAIAAAGASVKHIDHDRAFGGADISTVRVVCTVETRDAAHIADLHRSLQDHGIRVLSCAVVPGRG